jgi:hypothetical protein
MITKNKKGENNFVDLQDAVNDSKNKLRFVSEFFNTGHPGYNFEISETATNGLGCILREIETELELVVDKLDVMKKRAAKTNP